MLSCRAQRSPPWRGPEWYFASIPPQPHAFLLFDFHFDGWHRQAHLGDGFLFGSSVFLAGCHATRFLRGHVFIATVFSTRLGYI
jgi:hypothetical protein